MLDPGFHAVDQVLGADVADDLVRLPRGRFLRRAPRNDPVGMPSTFFVRSVALVLAAAPRRNPHGVTQICNCCAHAAFAGVIIWL